MNDNVTRYESDSLSTSPYSVRNRNSELVFFDGQDPDDETIRNHGIRKQTVAALERVRAVAAEAGIDVEDLIRTTVYLTEMDHAVAVEQAYDEFFDGQRPSQTLIGVEALPNDAAVQIEATGVNR